MDISNNEIFFSFLGESLLLFTNIKVGSDKVKYKKVYQRNAKDCGVACLLSVIKYYKGCNTFENLRFLTKCSDNGITALNLIEAGKKLGFDSKGIKCSYEDLYNLQKPMICHFRLKNGYNHYVVLYEIGRKYLTIFDPYYGMKKYKKDEFLEKWTNIVITLKPIRKLDLIKENNTYYIKDIILKNKTKYLIVIIISLLIVLLTLVCNSYFKILIDSKNMFITFLIYLFIVLFREIIMLYRNTTLVNLENGVLKELNLKTHKRLLSLPYYYFNSRNSGDIITKFDELNHIKNILVDVPIYVLIDITLLILTSVILSKISLKLFLIFFTSCLLYLVVLIIYNTKIKNLVQVNQEANSIKNSCLHENINCIDTIKNMDISNLRYDVFKTSYNNLNKSNLCYEKFCVNINFVKNIILSITINLILYLGIDMVKNNMLTFSNLILFNSLVMYFIEPINEIYDLCPLIKNGINAFKRVGEIYSIDINNQKREKFNNFDIEFNSLSYSYDGYNKVFEDVNYRINESDKVIVVGKSGCGKSTLFKLLSNVYDLEEGDIKLGNDNIKDIYINSHITYVSQEEKLFNDTLRNNIILNNDTSNLEDILKITGVKEIMNKKNITLDSIIEEEGTNFSKGEKQKIILCRVLLKSSKIIIFDESLSGVEEIEEYKIMKYILSRFKDKTIIYISHSRACVSLFNKILNFDKKEDLWNYQKMN